MGIKTDYPAAVSDLVGIPDFQNQQPLDNQEDYTMTQPYTTRLTQFQLTQDERLQVVSYYDVLSPEDDPTARDGKTFPRVFGPETGLTREGHGKGIRVLVHQDMTAVECGQLLKEILRDVEAEATKEMKNKMPY